MLLESFLVDVYALEKDLTASTVKLYKSTVRNIESWASRPVLVSDLTDDFLNRWLVFLGTTAICKTTIANHRRFLLALWRHAFQDRLTDVPPLRVRKIQTPRTLPEAWSVDQMTRLLEATEHITGRDIPIGVKRSAFWRALILVAWSTGLRLGDIERIKRDQIGADGSLIMRQQKTSWPVLCKLSAESMAAVEKIGHTPSGFIFGGRLSRGVIFSDFRTLAGIAGLSGTSKKIRKSGATAVESSQPGAAKGFLGHQSHGLSYKHYVDPTKLGTPRPEPPGLTG